MDKLLSLHPSSYSQGASMRVRYGNYSMFASKMQVEFFKMLFRNIVTIPFGLRYALSNLPNYLSIIRLPYQVRIAALSDSRVFNESHHNTMPSV
jgi:hypothetical protein